MVIQHECSSIRWQTVARNCYVAFAGEIDAITAEGVNKSRDEVHIARLVAESSEMHRDDQFWFNSVGDTVQFFQRNDRFATGMAEQNVDTFEKRHLIVREVVAHIPVWPISIPSSINLYIAFWSGP